MAEEDKVEMMTLEGLDVRALGERDRIVLGLAIGVAARRFRHSPKEQETEDWLARAALDLLVCEDVTTAAKEAVVRVATGGEEGKAVVDLILLHAGASLAMLGRAVRDVGVKPELEVHEGGRDGEADPCGESTEAQLNAALEGMYEKGGKADVVLNAKGKLTLGLIDLLGEPLDVDAGNRFHKWLAIARPDLRISIAKELRADLAAKIIPAQPKTPGTRVVLDLCAMSLETLEMFADALGEVGCGTMSSIEDWHGRTSPGPRQELGNILRKALKKGGTA